MDRKLMSLALSLALVPSVFAISGKTMYHYIAYEAAFWPKDKPINAASYRSIELDQIHALPFDTLVFAPVFGFGDIAGNLKSASYPKHQPQADSRWMRNWKNAMPELIKSGNDPIDITIKWCRENKREAVVALPVNLDNTHTRAPDAKNAPNSWRCYLHSDFKKQNPDCLMDPSNKASVPYAYRWDVDYTQAKVRDKFTAIAAEIAGKYDIDGIMIDFTMRPVLFASVATGGVAAPKETTLITEMMTKIKAACKAASARLGHPVAFSARVPDSVGYCKDIGIDLQGWMDTKLLDYVVFGGFFQLSPYSAIAPLAQKAGIPYYVSFTQSGIHVGNDSGYVGDDERMPRNSREVCRARMMDAFRNKATGCVYTMGQHWDVQMSKSVVEPFDPKFVRMQNKRYFVSYTNDRIAAGTLKDGLKHRVVPSLVSGSAIELSKGSAKYSIEVWDDFDALKANGVVPQLTLITEVEIPSGVETIVSFNGKEIKPFKKRSGTQLYKLTTKEVKQGANEVMVKSKGRNKRGGVAKLGNIAMEVTFPKEAAK